MNEIADFAGIGGELVMDGAERAEIERLRTVPRIEYASVRRLKDKWLRRSFDRFLQLEVARGTAESSVMRVVVAAGDDAGVEIYANLHVGMCSPNAFDERGLIGFHVANEETGAGGKQLVENRFDQRDDESRRDGVEHHRDHRPRQAASVGFRVPEEPEKRVHSVKRYFRSTHSATTPSRQVIFLPSS